MAVPEQKQTTLTTEQKELVQSTFVKVTLVANQAGEWFYGRLFELDPALKPLFANTIIHVQSTKLMQMLAIAVSGLDHPDELATVMKELGQRHVNYGVKPEYYPIVGQALLFALAHVLGDEFTPDVEEAWTAAYSILTSFALRE